MNVTQTEPVAVAGGVTAVAGALVTIGQLTGLYHLSADAAVSLVAAVVVAATAVTHWWARRRVTPTAKLTGPQAPPAGVSDAART